MTAFAVDKRHVGSVAVERLLSLGKTYVVADATATFDKVDFCGQLRLAEEVHALSLANLHGEYATVVSTAELLATIKENAG